MERGATVSATTVLRGVLATRALRATVRRAGPAALLLHPAAAAAAAAAAVAMASSPGLLFSRSLKWGALLSLSQKVVSFTLNQLLVRWTSPEVFGLASIELELMLSTLLFLSREGIRLALLRETLGAASSRAQVQQFVNLSWVPCIVVISLSLLLHYYFVRTAGGRPTTTAWVVVLYCIGATLEAMGEPWVNVYQNFAMMIPKMQAESVGVFIKSIVTFATVAYLDLGVVGFGCAQVAYGLVYLIVLVFHTRSVKRDGNISMRLAEFLPGPTASYSPTDGEILRGAPLFGGQAISVTLAATGSCLLKHVLTEADKIFLSLTQSHYDQGIFSVANNYASLIVRVLFLPLEDSARVVFSKMSNTNSVTARATRQSRQAEQMSITVLLQLLRVVALVGIVFPLFGPSHVEVVVWYAFGSKWRGSNAIEQTLVAFCFYIFILGLNGISEAFVNVAASRGAGFAGMNFGLVVSFGIYATVASILVVRIGTSGIVYANCAAMLVRIVSSFWFIGSRFDCPWTSLLPSAQQAMAMFVASSFCFLSSRRYNKSGHGHRDALEHVSVGAIVFLALIVSYKKVILGQIKRLRNA